MKEECSFCNKTDNVIVKRKKMVDNLPLLVGGRVLRKVKTVLVCHVCYNQVRRCEDGLEYKGAC